MTEFEIIYNHGRGRMTLNLENFFARNAKGVFVHTYKTNINANLGAIVMGCSGDDAKIAGTPCTPLQVTQDNSQDNKEGNKNTVQLASSLRSGPLGRIAKSLIPLTDDDEVNAVLGLPAAAAAGS